jgi:PAS domain S-box-containing protein
MRENPERQHSSETPPTRREPQSRLAFGIGDTEPVVVEVEEELRDFIENATVALHWVGADGLILWANKAELCLLGYDAREYIGRPISDFHVDAANIEEMLARLGRDEELHNHEARLRAKDGSIKHVLISSSVYRRDNQFVHTRCFTLDVTERRVADLARKSAHRRTERLNRVMAAIVDAATAEQVFEAVVDHVGTALAASSSALWLVRGENACLARAAGYAEQAKFLVESMIPEAVAAGILPAFDSMKNGHPIWILSPDELVRRYPRLASIVTNGRSYRFVSLPVSAREGIIGALDFSFDDNRPLDDDEKAFLLLVARFTGQALERVQLYELEREHRVRAEILYRLAASVNRAEQVGEVFEAALDAIAGALKTHRAAILVFDADRVIRFKAWRGLSEAYRSAVEGHSPWSPETVDAKPISSGAVETDPTMAPYLEAFRREGIGALAFIPLVVGGRLTGKFMIYYDRPHEFASREIDLAVAIADHVATAISRASTAESLQRTVRFNEMFTGILAHDLRNPLSSIIMAARLANTWNDSGKLGKPLSRILKSAERMTRMIDQLLDFTRIRLQGRIPIFPSSSDLSSILRQVIDELDGVNVGWQIRLKDLGDTAGHWDADRLTQVFSNLVANAIQHGKAEWGVEVTIDGRAS